MQAREFAQPSPFAHCKPVLPSSVCKKPANTLHNTRSSNPDAAWILTASSQDRLRADLSPDGQIARLPLCIIKWNADAGGGDGWLINWTRICWTTYSTPARALAGLVDPEFCITIGNMIPGLLEQTVFGRLTSLRQVILILGARQVGKTTLLSAAESRLANAGQRTR